MTKESSFENLPEKNSSVSIHDRIFNILQLKCKKLVMGCLNLLSAGALPEGGGGGGGLPSCPT